MGLLAPVAEFILSEHAHRAIEGEVLFVGRQTTFFDEPSFSALLEKYGLTRPPGAAEIDTSTVGGRGGRFVTDRYFMRALGIEKLRFVDVSDYEGADIVWDLGYPVEPSLHERFDFIYNGGCLDNMFNPAGAIVNFSKMLKPGGRVVCMESASSWNAPYLMFSPGWFFDYYATNGFCDCKVYVCSYRTNDDLCFGPWDLFYFDWALAKNGQSPEAIHSNHLLVMVVAEKADNSTAEKQPIQFQYRSAELNEEFERRVRRFAESRRPVITGVHDQRSAKARRWGVQRSRQHAQPVHYPGERYLRSLGMFGGRAASR
jgi:SAM-dependent methyltransferase